MTAELNIGSLLARESGKLVNHFRYGYPTSPTILLTLYALKDLNSKNFDFRTAKVKKVNYKNTMFQVDGSGGMVAGNNSTTFNNKSIIWYEDNIKKSTFSVATLDPDSDNNNELTLSGNPTMVVGDIIRIVLPSTATANTYVNNKTFLVTAVDGAKVILNGQVTAGNNVDVSTQLYIVSRVGFAKTYGEYSARQASLNTSNYYQNYFQFHSEEIPQDKTDVMANNLNRYFYEKPEDYIAEFFADASREIVKDQVFSMYIGQPGETANGQNKIYTTGGLEYFASGYLNNNIYDASDRVSLSLLREQLKLIYNSGVNDITRKGRVVLFCNTELANAINDAMQDRATLFMPINEALTEYNINMKRLTLGNYSIDVVEDLLLNEIYPVGAYGWTMDLDSIFNYNIMNGVIGADGKRVEQFGASQLWAKPQTTYEQRVISLNTAWSWMFGGIGSGCYRQITCNA